MVTRINIGDNKIILLDNNKNGQEKIINTASKECKLTITNLDGSFKKLDLSKNDRVVFEYFKNTN